MMIRNKKGCLNFFIKKKNEEQLTAVDPLEHFTQWQ
jgi:hypothetical protein